MKPGDGRSSPQPDDAIRSALLSLVRDVALDLRPHKAATLDVALDSTLDRDLGFDSLGRVELLQRLERAFGVRLPDQVMLTAETPRDLLRALQAAVPASGVRPTPPVVQATPERPVTLPAQAETLGDVLDWHAQRHPDRVHIRLIEDADDTVLTYADLHLAARSVAAALRQLDVQAGHRVALMLPTGRNFFACFTGILVAGAIPVPLYPPTRPSQVEEHLRRQVGILNNAGCVLLLTMPEVKPLARLLRAQVPALERVLTPDELPPGGDGGALPRGRGQDTALLQYTSGSTGTPKGVILSHANLLTNIRAMNQVAQTRVTDVFVSWLPLYHDMGLIGAWLGSLYCAYPLVVMSPLSFLARPARWLWAIHTYRGSISGGPNFAYELCVQRLTDDDLLGLDLSAWRLAFCGAEPVSPETLERFAERFAPYGLRPEALLPVYGLAENTLGLTFPPPGRGVRVDRVERQAFQRQGRALPVSPQEPHALRFVGCGYPLPGHEVRIVDALGFEVAERQEGRLEFRGPSATSGYFRNPEATADLFDGDWLDSGDLAYIAEGEVFVTGRAKDLIIRAGRNLVPHELEAAVGSVPGIRKGCVAVFGSPDPRTHTERLVVLAETRLTDAGEQAGLRQQIESLCVDLLGGPPDDVVLAPPHTILKTSSGKIRRSACRDLYERGRLGTAGRTRAVWWQVVRFAASGVAPELRRLARVASSLLYAAYAGLVAAVLALPAWCAATLLPLQSWRQRSVRWLARLALRLAGIPVFVQGLEQLPRNRPYVAVVNHASYVDAIVLLAVLPPEARYVAKQELANQALLRAPMRGLGVAFVERFEAQRGLEDTARVLKAVQQGHPMVFFPEGTFGREPGLRAFRMGAFVVAAQAGVPVIPMSLRGTRSILRAGAWLLRRGAVRLRIGSPLLPSGSDWAAAVALRDAARAQMLQMGGEPDLGEVSFPL